MSTLAPPVVIDPDNVQRPGILKLMKIGYTLDGVFDPEHEDFKCCCCHVHCGIKLLIVFIVLSVLFNFFGFLRMEHKETLNYLEVVTMFSGLTLLILGVFAWKKCYSFLKVYLFMIVFAIMTYFGFLFYLAAAVIVAVTKKTDKTEREQWESESLLYLYLAIMTAMDLFVYIYAFFIVYIEYKYLSGRIKNGLV